MNDGACWFGKHGMFTDALGKIARLRLETEVTLTNGDVVRGRLIDVGECPGPGTGAITDNYFGLDECRDVVFGSRQVVGVQVKESFIWESTGG